MSNSQIPLEPLAIFAKWRELCDAMIALGEVYAASDPANGHLYRHEAKDLCSQGPATIEADLVALASEGETLRRAWLARSRGRENS